MAAKADRGSSTVDAGVRRHDFAVVARLNLD